MTLNLRKVLQHLILFQTTPKNVSGNEFFSFPDFPGIPGVFPGVSRLFTGCFRAAYVEARSAPGLHMQHFPPHAAVTSQIGPGGHYVPSIAQSVGKWANRSERSAIANVLYHAQQFCLSQEK